MKKYIAMAAVAMVAAGSMKTQAAEITEDISIGGDIRFRHESIDAEGKETRDRQRVRARVSLDADVTDGVKAKFRLASGSSDPVSSNQTLDGGFSSKDFNLDRAYIEWAPVPDAGATLMLGKMKNPWAKMKGLVWDSDLNPEGVALQAGNDTIFFNAAYLIAEERSSDDETFMVGAQIGSNVKLTDAAKAMVGISYFGWDNMKGHGLLFDEEDSFGNSTIEAADGSLTYAEDFGQFQAFGKVSIKAGLPISVYADYIVNNDADGDQDTAYLVGFGLGKTKDPGSWSFDYNFREVEADAVVGAFTDSDSFGGGTDGDGSKLGFKYQLAKSWEFNATYFINKQGIQPGHSSKDYDRLQLDLIASF
jgi:hypothetical protein